jgi:hypothetical protein
VTQVAQISRATAVRGSDNTRREKDADDSRMFIPVAVRAKECADAVRLWLDLPRICKNIEPERLWKPQNYSDCLRSNSVKLLSNLQSTRRIPGPHENDKPSCSADTATRPRGPQARDAVRSTSITRSATRNPR